VINVLIESKGVCSLFIYMTMPSIGPTNLAVSKNHPFLRLFSSKYDSTRGKSALVCKLNIKCKHLQIQILVSVLRDCIQSEII
jgi:hypothetical protein